MSPKRKAEHPVEIHPDYLTELRRRIETGPGFGAVADAAGMSRMTLWRVLNGGGAQRVTADAVERARLGLASLEPGGEPMPPPIVSVSGTVHHAWIRIGEELISEDEQAVAAAVKALSPLRAAVGLPKTPPIRRKR